MDGWVGNLFLAVADFQVLTFSTFSSWDRVLLPPPAFALVDFIVQAVVQSPRKQRQCSQTWPSGSESQLTAAVRRHSHFQCFCAASGGWEREECLEVLTLSWVFSKLEKKVGGLKGQFAKRIASDGSACRPALLESAFLYVSAHGSSTGLHLFPRDAGKQFYCQCIFIFACFRRQFVGLSALVGVSEPMFNASESTRLCTVQNPFPIFKPVHYPHPVIITVGEGYPRWVELRRALQICNDAPSGMLPFSSGDTAHSIMFTLWQKVKSHPLKWEGLIVSGYQEVSD